MWSWEESNPRLSRFSSLKSDSNTNISKYIFRSICPFCNWSHFKAVISLQMTVKIHSKLIETESRMNMANSLLSGRPDGPNVCDSCSISYTEIQSHLLGMISFCNDAKIMPENINFTKM
jgi:hypothetical protein